MSERALAWALALLAVIHHALVYALGERLIVRQHGQPARFDAREKHFWL